jgi:hypothetical protein
VAMYAIMYVSGDVFGQGAGFTDSHVITPAEHGR